MNQEPSDSVRDTLLAEAAHIRFRSAVGPSIPPLANGLRESTHSVSPNGSIWLPVFSGHDVAEYWLLMIAPVYAIR